eukprot:358731-Chlamydomonas_euryale.AAC.7
MSHAARCHASRSNTREPLGRTYHRGHKLPEGMGTEVPFGCVYNGRVSRAAAGGTLTMARKGAAACRHAGRQAGRHAGIRTCMRTCRHA